MDRRGFLKGAVAISATVLAPTVKPAPGSFAYVRHYWTNVGAPAGTSCFFGKHTQWAYCPTDGKLYAYGGDGDWRLPDVGFKQQQSLNSVLSYDFAHGGAFTQESKQFGNPADGTMPFYDDGCTWVYNSQEDKFYSIPGYQPPYKESLDPNKIARRGIVHKFNRKTGAWEAGPKVGTNWVGEHWGGCYDSKRNRIWIQTAMGNENGGLKWFDCTTETWGKVGLRRIPNLKRFPNIGYELVTSAWCQRYNPVTDEIICFDARRGHVVAVPLGGLPESPMPRIVADVPAYRNDVTGEPVGTIEAGVCLSVRRQKAFISYSKQAKYVIGGVGGVWAIDLTTGKTDHVDYPDPPGTDSQWTQAEYDETNDQLILAADIEDPTVWGKRFLGYEFSDRAPQRKPGAALGAPVAWLRNVPLFQWIDIPNSKPWTFFVDGKGVDPSYLQEIGITGANYPSSPSYRLGVPANKYGIRPTRYGVPGYAFRGWPWGAEHTTFSGMALDDSRFSGKPTNLMIGGGDAHWPDNTVVRFVFGVDSPRWEVAILGAHASEWKNEWPFDRTSYDPLRFPDDNTLTAKFYDGSRRGGHNYMGFWYCGKRDWFLAFESHQYWNHDSGRGLEVSISDLKVTDVTGFSRWDTSKIPVIADLPVTPAQPDQPWKQKHPITEDVWQLCNRSMVVWRQASNTYDIVWTWGGMSWAWDNAAGGINWDANLILLVSRYGGSDATGTAHTNVWWTFSIADNRQTIITRVTGPHASAITGEPRYHSCIWCPDLGKWLYYTGSENVYTIGLVNRTTIHVERLKTAGSMDSANLRRRAGGVLNNFQYCRQLKGVVWVVADRRPIKFMRTG